jgi:hypothetical protein
LIDPRLLRDDDLEGMPELSEVDVIRHFTRLSTWNYCIDHALSVRFVHDEVQSSHQREGRSHRRLRESTSAFTGAARSRCVEIVFALSSVWLK